MKDKRVIRLICAAAAALVMLWGHAVQETRGRGAVNVLLCGTDRGADGPRAGAIVILTADTLRGGIRLTNVSGALVLPAEGRDETLSARWGECGTRGIADLLSAWLGVGIDRYVSVDMEGFRVAVDLCGGLEIDLTEEDAAALSQRTGKETASGSAVLDGAGALDYVRLGGERQMRFLTAMARSVLSRGDLGTLLDLAEQVLPYMETDLTAADLMAVIFAALAGGGGPMETCRLPGEGEYVPADGVPEGIALTDAAAAAERFRRFALDGRGERP